MRQRSAKLTLSGVEKYFNYNPDTGGLTWAIRVCKKKPVGAIAGYLTSDGYRTVKVNGQGFRAHRVAYRIMTGSDPVDEIDHINGDRSDNRWCNLRPCAHYENGQNKVNRPVGVSGFTGVTWSNTLKAWVPKIKLRGDVVHGGVYRDLDEAIAVRKGLRKSHHKFQPVPREEACAISC